MKKDRPLDPDTLSSNLAIRPADVRAAVEQERHNQDIQPMKSLHLLFSKRGHQIVLSVPPVEVILVTISVELYPKWYALQLLRPAPMGIEVEDLPFPGSKKMTPYVDHDPNPQVVKAYADEHGYEIDELAFELIVGRWSLR